MREYSGWQAIFFSFWSPSFYRDVARHWTGSAYGYLLALLACVVFFDAVKVQLIFPPSYHLAMRPIYDQLPDFKFENGLASINKSSPYQIYNVQMQPFIKFDMENVDDNPTLGDEAILITKKGKIVSRGAKTPSKSGSTDGDTAQSDAASNNSTFELSSLNSDFSLSAQQVVLFLNGLVDHIGLFDFFLRLPWNFIVCVVQSFFYALVGMVITKLVRIPLSFMALIRLTVTAMTPTLILDSICNLADYTIYINGFAPMLGGFPVDLKSIAAVLLTFCYLIFAIYSCRSMSAPEPLVAAEAKA